MNILGIARHGALPEARRSFSAQGRLCAYWDGKVSKLPTRKPALVQCTLVGHDRETLSRRSCSWKPSQGLESQTGWGLSVELVRTTQGCLCGLVRGTPAFGMPLSCLNIVVILGRPTDLWLKNLVICLGGRLSSSTPSRKVDLWLEGAVDHAYHAGERLCGWVFLELNAC